MSSSMEVIVELKNYFFELGYSLHLIEILNGDYRLG